MDAKEKLRMLALHQLVPAQKMIREGFELEPMLCFEMEAGMGLAAIPQYAKPELEGTVILSLRELLKEQKAERYTFTMEARVGEVKRSEYERSYLPSKDPGRHEAIIVSAADCEGNKLLLKCKIMRGETVTFSEPVVLNTTSGPLLELLDDKPTIN